MIAYRPSWAQSAPAGGWSRVRCRPSCWCRIRPRRCRLGASAMPARAAGSSLTWHGGARVRGTHQGLRSLSTANEAGHMTAGNQPQKCSASPLRTGGHPHKRFLVHRQHHRVARYRPTMSASLAMNSGSRRHGPQGQADSLGHGATGPVGRLARRLAAGRRHHTPHYSLRCRRLAGFSRLVAQQPVDAGLGEALRPAPHRWPADPARRATSATSSRSAEARMIRACATCFCGRLRSARIAAKRWRSSAETRANRL